MITKGLGSNYRHPDDLSMSRNRRQYMTRRDCRDTWYAVARIRERNGDTEGAQRARRSARYVSGDNRVRHDI